MSTEKFDTLADAETALINSGLVETVCFEELDAISNYMYLNDVDAEQAIAEANKIEDGRPVAIQLQQPKQSEKTMIKINEQFSIKSYQFGWVLESKVETKSDKAKNEFTVATTYWPNLKLVCCAVLDRSAKGCDSVSGVLNALESAKSDLAEMIEKVGNK